MNAPVSDGFGLLLQAPPDQSPLGFLMPMAIIFLIFYLLVIRRTAVGARSTRRRCRPRARGIRW